MNCNHSGSLAVTLGGKYLSSAAAARPNLLPVLFTNKCEEIRVRSAASELGFPSIVFEPLKIKQCVKEKIAYEYK